MNKLLIETIGWYGAIAIVFAYILVSFSFIQPSDLAYQLLNVTGAVSVVIVSFYKRAWQPGVLNIIWAIVALLATFEIVLR